MERAPRKTLLRGLFFAIVDEADSVLIDEARTPLLISRSTSDVISNATRAHALEIARPLLRGRHYEIVHAQRRVELTPAGCAAVTAAPVPDDSIWEIQMAREELVQQAVAALHLFRRDHDYVVQDGAVVIVDEHTGRLMPDRSWSVGLHQMIEIKEGCEPSAPTETLARMTYQRFFRRYCMLAGMSGTLREVAPELWSVYNLSVTQIPTHRRRQVRNRRTRICRTAAEKWRLIAERTRSLHVKGAPVLIGTESVEASLEASRALDALGLGHVVLNAEQSRQEAEIVARAGLHKAITVATNMAGRGTDIKLGQGIKELGGLHVIMSQRYESRRVDRQLLGRCGRQGDPGCCEIILSFDDSLIRVWCPLLTRTARRLAPYVGSWPGRIVMRVAQLKAEGTHTRMRRDLLKSDRLQGKQFAFTGRQE
jgi:preprotein translocase subunit SecA